MSSQGFILLSGLTAGLLGIALAVAASAGWVWIVAAYVIGGNVGMVAMALMVARARSLDPSAIS